MINRRKIKRTKCALRARLNDGPETTIQVKMFDFSSRGARIQLAQAQGLPQKVLLIFGANKIPAECEWQKGNEIGLSFESPIGNTSNPGI